MRSLPLCSRLVALTLACLCACQSTSEPAYPNAHLERVLTVESGGVHTTTLKDFEALDWEQKEPVWCWAACAEMILRFNGEEATQESIATRIHGADKDGGTKIEAASFYEVMRALNPDMDVSPFDSLWAQVAARAEDDPSLVLNMKFGVDAAVAASAALDQFVPNKQVAVEDLRNGHPAVVGLADPELPDMGHAYVLIGAVYTINKSGDWSKQGKKWFDDLGEALGQDATPDNADEMEDVADKVDGERYSASEVTLVDPWTGTVVTMTGEEFSNRVDFVISRRQARKTLSKWQSIATVK